MNVAAAVGSTALLLALFAAIAIERTRAYALPAWRSKACALVACALALSTGAWAASHGAGGWVNPVLLACGAVSAVTDVESGYIFDRVVGLAGALLLGIALSCGRAADGASGAALGAGALLLVCACSRGRGMGLGDVKLAAALGLGLGSAGMLAALWFAALGGGLAATLALLLRRARRGSAIPFAPFLALGAWFAIVRAA